MQVHSKISYILVKNNNRSTEIDLVFSNKKYYSHSFELNYSDSDTFYHTIFDFNFLKNFYHGEFSINLDFPP